VPAAPPAPEPPARVIVITPGVGRVRGSPVRTVFSMLVLALIVMFASGITFFTNRMKAITGGRIAEVPGVTLPSIVSSSFMWDTVGGPPMPATVGNGGVEGFVGRLRTHGDDDLWYAAFEGAKLAEVWKVGPFGTYSQGYQSTFASLVGHHVVVTDYRANVHVYDVTTGKESHTLKLSDRAKAMCAAPDGKSHVWIEVSDEKNVLFDAEAGTASPAQRPAWCPDDWATSNDCRGWLKRGPPRLTCRGAEAAPKVNAFQAENVIEEGDLGVALGKKHPGTGVPMAVGFDPKSKALRWEQPLSSGDQTSVAESSTTSIMDALAGGRFVAPYETAPKGWHFTAFDARSGQRLWEVPLQPLIGVDNPEGFALSATRVYVMRTSSLEVYDARTGTLVGTVPPG
jgi:hypothetical protein